MDWILYNFIFATLTIIGFFFVYKRTHQYAVLAMGTMSYIELLFRCLTIKTIYFVPFELICIVWLIYMLYKTNSNFILMILFIEVIAYLILMMMGIKFHGEAGFCFMLVTLLWYDLNRNTVCVDPFKCDNG